MNSASSQVTTPTLVTGRLSLVQIDAGAYHTCGREATGAVSCWGADTHGAVGDGSTTLPTSPTRVGNWLCADVRAGGYMTCGRMVSGAPHCWGSNISGELGDGTLLSRLVPTPLVRLP